MKRPGFDFRGRPIVADDLLADEVVERAALAAWVADLGTQGQGATDAELRFGWEHMPPSHRRAWMKRARLILEAALDA